MIMIIKDMDSKIPITGYWFFTVFKAVNKVGMVNKFGVNYGYLTTLIYHKQGPISPKIFQSNSHLEEKSLAKWTPGVWKPKESILFVKFSRALNVVAHYRQTSNISGTKSQNWNVSRLVLQLFFANPLKPDVKSRIKI